MAPDEDELPATEASANEWSVSVALDEAVPLHSIAEAKWHSLAETRRATDAYLKQADALIDGLWGGSLDSEEHDLILSTLGEPPPFCLPIYLVSVGQGNDEKVVYVGKTRSSTRFANGHRVGLKLHHPKYARLSKTVYRCSVLLDVHDEYVALEWVEPEGLAEKILDCVESVLIHALQPELNVAKRCRPSLDMPMHIHVQNYTNSDLLDGLMLWQRNGEPLGSVPVRNVRKKT
nr:hypothetical protein [uncultured Pseudogulbenkiania sp.]